MILLDLPISREYFLASFLKEGLQPRIHSRLAHQEVVGTAVLVGRHSFKLCEAFKGHCPSYISDAYIPGMVAPMFD